MSKVSELRIILLGTNSKSTKILYNSLKTDFKIQKIIIEEKESKFFFLKRRFKRIGFLKLLDQLLFIYILSKFLHYLSYKRYDEILINNNLSILPLNSSLIVLVKSVNEFSTIELINSLNPDIIVLSGTRILSSNFLDSVNCQILNIHAGITPYFRGVHGAYWAYLNKQSNLAGVTLHRVDKGIDTGQILGQGIIQIQSNDNFSTYPLLQLNLGIDLLKKYLSKSDRMELLKSDNNSILWYHPGFFQYLYYRFFHGVK
ncbi:formyl transferase [Flavobacterium sp.]|uniref:formyl transferase n=1 Tax=Flavobacterium sp. TaxID=239 RepID=UPI004048DA8D